MTFNLDQGLNYMCQLNSDWPYIFHLHESRLHRAIRNGYRVKTRKIIEAKILRPFTPTKFEAYTIVRRVAV